MLVETRVAFGSEGVRGRDELWRKGVENGNFRNSGSTKIKYFSSCFLCRAITVIRYFSINMAEFEEMQKDARIFNLTFNQWIN